MGSETSRPLEAPQEFGASGEQFQIISPVSDISCPSDIHRIYRNRHNHEIANPSLPTVVDANRQVSRTVAKKHSGQNPALHAPTRVSEGVPPPSHFYFPSKETERAVEEAERKARREANKENRRPRFFKKTKKIFKKTQIAMKGCFVEPPVDAQLEQQQLAEEAQRNPGTLGIDKNKQEIFSPTKVDRYLTTVSTSVPVIQEEPELEEEAVPKKKSLGKTKPSFVIREAEGFVEPEQYSKPIELPGNSATIDVGAALHHAEDYFSRLSGGSAEASPYVENKAVQKLSSMLGKEDPDSPVSNLFEGRKSGGVASVLSRTVDSIIEENLDAAPATTKANRQSISSIKSGRQSFGKPFVSPTSSMIRYQTAIGTIAATPGYYSVQSIQEDDQSDPVFADDSTDTSNVSSKAKQLQLVKAESPRDGDDSSSCLSYMRPNEATAQSAFRPRQVTQKAALQQVATLGPKKSEVEPKQKISKLESLFRPVLPTLSADDGSASGSYDPWEIRVTESAPCYLESGDFRTMALQARTGGTPTSLGNPQRPDYTTSPSLMSMDSQMVSPSMAQTMVSNQASNNAGFLFASENDKPLLRNRKSDNSLFSINTLAARSRLSTRSNAKAVAIVPKTHALPSPSESSYKSNDRQVRFSLLDAVTDSASVALALRESIDVPTVESSSVSEKASISSGSMESILKPAEKTEEVKPAQKQTVSFSADCSTEQETPERKGLWCSNGNGATPYKQGADLKKHTNSPYLRFQSAKTRFESYGTVDVHEIPEIQNKVSDLTDITSDVPPQQSQPARLSEETAVTAKSVQSAPAGPVNWSYTIKDGNVTHVSPAYGGNADLPAKSPYLRFENAKTMFDKNADGGMKKVQTKKEVPYKSPRKSKAKQAIKSTRSVKSAGSVASKIEELNQRVVDAKIDRKNHRWTKSNPRKYTVVDSNAVRTRAIVNYKTTVVGLKAINTMAAAKFNTIPIDDDSSVESHDDEHEHAVDDDASKLSVATGDMSKLTIGSATVATVRQEHANTQVSQPNTIRMSEGTYSTTGSGLSNVRKQVFRSSLSVVSTSDSTTMSSILNKENATAYQFRPTNKSVKPEQQARFASADPSHPQKWRSLAAAAHQRDSAKKVAKPFNNRGLSVRNMNTQPIAAGFYEC